MRFIFFLFYLIWTSIFILITIFPYLFGFNFLSRVVRLFKYRNNIKHKFKCKYCDCHNEHFDGILACSCKNCLCIFCNKSVKDLLLSENITWSIDYFPWPADTYPLRFVVNNCMPCLTQEEFIIKSIIE